MNWKEFDKLTFRRRKRSDFDKIRKTFEKIEKYSILGIDYSYKNIIQFDLQIADYFPVLTTTESDLVFIAFIDNKQIDFVQIYYYSFYNESMITITRKRNNHFFETLSKIKSKIRKEKIHKLCQYIY